MASAPAAACCSANMTWKSGLCDRLRSGCSSSTSFSNGSSEWAATASTSARTCARSSWKLMPRRGSARTSAVLAKHPTTLSSSVRWRLATGTPTTTSPCPV